MKRCKLIHAVDEITHLIYWRGFPPVCHAARRMEWRRWGSVGHTC